MNRQRKVLITVTYNEMGIIIDTKAEEVAQPNLQPTCNNLATDTISRQAAIDNLKRNLNETDVPDHYPGIFNAIEEWLSDWEVPSAQPEQPIYEVLTVEEVTKEVSATSLFSYMEWFKVFRRVSQMGYMICRKPE